ncbi:MAG: GNAT family N-acetyltransferase [Pedobacter sp.]|nr:GNAT family N-acetyltransferase [Pedobacter sp.]MDQ8054077.1 GNAT family N-acetyltransferase [Pedobacter sp.]
MIALQRTSSTNPDFIELVQQLDAYLAEKDGPEHAFYAQYNKVDLIPAVIVAYEHEIPVGCGAIKPYSQEAMEVKRMYTLPTARKKGVAGQVLSELENWAREMGYQSCVLETGKRQTEAVAFYHKMGYRATPNYGQYANVENSICFEKAL